MREGGGGERRRRQAAATTTLAAMGKRKGKKTTRSFLYFGRLSLPPREPGGPFLHPRTSKRRLSVGRRGDLGHPSSLEAGTGRPLFRCRRPFPLLFLFLPFLFFEQVNLKSAVSNRRLYAMEKTKERAPKVAPLAPRITSRLRRGAEKSLRSFPVGEKGPRAGLHRGRADKVLVRRLFLRANSLTTPESEKSEGGEREVFLLSLFSTSSFFFLSLFFFLFLFFLQFETKVRVCTTGVFDLHKTEIFMIGETIDDDGDGDGDGDGSGDGTKKRKESAFLSFLFFFSFLFPRGGRGEEK